MSVGTIPKLIVVTSHRGGSMKSTVSALLAQALAERGRRTVLVDAAIAGGVASLADERLQAESAPIGNVQLRKMRGLPLVVVHDPDILEERAELPGLLDWAAQDSTEYLILDLPGIETDELRVLASRASIVLLTVPADALALRSLLPFLRDVQAQRALPGRDFATIALPVRTGVQSPTGIATDRFIQEHLSPLMVGATMPADDRLAAQVSSGHFPSDLSPLLRSNLDLLIDGIERQLARMRAIA